MKTLAPTAGCQKKRDPEKRDPIAHFSSPHPYPLFSSLSIKLPIKQTLDNFRQFSILNF